MYQRSIAVTRDSDANAFPLDPTLHASSSSLATHVSPGITENLTTPGWSDHGPPTSSPVLPLIPTSPSASSLRHRYKTPRCSLDSGHSPDPLQIIFPARQGVDGHDSYPADSEMLDPASNPSREEHRHDTVLGGYASPSPSPISRMQPSPSADPFVVPVTALTEANQDEAYLGDVAGGRYSMRTRQPRQLKPYAIDRLEYKHQLKHHPDAIVRFAGLRNPIASSSSPAPSDAAESGTDGAAGHSADDRSSNHMPVNMQTKEKKRRRTGVEQHPATRPESSRVRLATKSSGQVGRRMSGPSAADIFSREALLPDQVGGNLADAPGTWYPDAFKDMSSALGSDDEPLSVVQRFPRTGHDPPSRAKRRRVTAWFHRRVCRANERFFSVLHATSRTCHRLLLHALPHRILPPLM